MRNIITLFFTLFVATVFCQDAITLNVSQDLKLATVGDDKGNNPFTLDMVVASEWQGNQSNYGYFFVRPEFEYSSLKGGNYKRYSVNVGVSFNQWVKRFTFTASCGYGWIDYNGSRFSIGTNLQTAYRLNKWLDVFIDLETAERRDLDRYTSSNKILNRAFVSSGKVGFKIKI